MRRSPLREEHERVASHSLGEYDTKNRVDSRGEGCSLHVTDNLAFYGLDLSPRIPEPELGKGVAARANLESALPGPLEQQREEAKVGVRAGAVVRVGDRHRRVEREVVQQAQHGLDLRVRDIVDAHEVLVVREAEAAREAAHETRRDVVRAAHYGRWSQ